MGTLVTGIIFVVAWAFFVWRYWHEGEGITLATDIVYNVILFITLTVGGTCIVYWLMCNTMFAFVLFG